MKQTLTALAGRVVRYKGLHILLRRVWVKSTSIEPIKQNLYFNTPKT